MKPATYKPPKLLPLLGAQGYVAEVPYGQGGVQPNRPATGINMCTLAEVLFLSLLGKGKDEN